MRTWAEISIQSNGKTLTSVWAIGFPSKDFGFSSGIPRREGAEKAVHVSFCPFVVPIGHFLVLAGLVCVCVVKKTGVEKYADTVEEIIKEKCEVKERERFMKRG